MSPWLRCIHGDSVCFSLYADVDECQTGLLRCQYGCVNTVGTAHCTCSHGYNVSMVTVYVSLSVQTWTSVRRGCYAVSIAVSTLWAECTARVPMVTSCKMTAGPVKVGSYPNSLKLKVGFHLEQN